VLSTGIMVPGAAGSSCTGASNPLGVVTDGSSAGFLTAGCALMGPEGCIWPYEHSTHTHYMHHVPTSGSIASAC
jgi:hypothetical protein